MQKRILTVLIALLLLQPALVHAIQFKLYPEHSESVTDVPEEKMEDFYILTDRVVDAFSPRIDPLYSNVDEIKLWRHYDGSYNRIWAYTALENDAVEEGLTSGLFKKTAIPTQALRPMHLPRNVSEDIMSCYTGTLDNKPVYLFWSKAKNRAVFVINIEQPH